MTSSLAVGIKTNIVCHARSATQPLLADVRLRMFRPGGAAWHLAGLKKMPYVSMLRRFHIGLVCVLLARFGAFAQQVQVDLDPARTKIAWTLVATMHNVHGTFRLKSGSVVIDPKTGAASGTIVVDATSGESGNSDRDRDMHTKVLQSAQYPDVTFLPKHVSGSIAEQGKFELQLHGTLRIHGADHEITLPITAERKGDDVTADTNLVVPYQQWGMKNPSKLFLKVEDKVEVGISTTGRITTKPSVSH